MNSEKEPAFQLHVLYEPMQQHWKGIHPEGRHNKAQGGPQIPSKSEASP